MEHAIKTPQGWKDAEAMWFRGPDGWILMNGEPNFDRPINGDSTVITKITCTRIYLDQDSAGGTWYCNYVERCDSEQCQFAVSYTDSNGVTQYTQQGGYACTSSSFEFTGLNTKANELGVLWEQNLGALVCGGFSGQEFVAYNIDGEMVCKGTMREAPQGSPNAFMITDYGNLSDGDTNQYWKYSWDCASSKTEGFYPREESK